MRKLARLATLAASLALLVPGHQAWAQQNGNGSGAAGSGYDWNGFYGGGNLGGGFGGSDFASAVPQGVPFLEGAVYAGGAFNPATPGIIAAYRSNDVDIRSATGGFQTGFNITAGGFLLGIEADINFLNAQKAKSTNATGSAVAGFGTTLYTFRSEIDSNYVASLRPRIGIPFGGAILYATGGVALTTLKYNHSFAATGGYFHGLNETASASETKAGWTLGGGVEIPVGPNVSFRSEYLFTDFGSVETNGNKIFPLGGFGNIPVIADVACGVDTGQVAAFNAAPLNAGLIGTTPRQCFNHKADLLLHTIRLGLNFKF